MTPEPIIADSSVVEEPVAEPSVNDFDLDEIFDWGEETYQDLFPEEQESTSVLGYYARMYSNGNGMGEKDGNIYFYDGGEAVF